jgi:hypothetical protein
METGRLFAQPPNPSEPGRRPVDAGSPGGTPVQPGDTVQPQVGAHGTGSAQLPGSAHAIGLIPATAQVRIVTALVALVPLAIALLVATRL